MPARIAPVRVSTPARVPSASVITATSTGACSSRSKTLRGSVPTGAVTKSVMATSRTRAKRSTPTQLASVTSPIGRPSKTTTAAPCARLWISAVASDTESSGDQRHRGVDDQVAALDEVDRLLDRRDRKVLRQNHDAAAAGDRLGHPPPGHRGHVGDDDGDGGAGAVRGRQVDVEPRRHVRPAGNDEDVVVGQVVRWRLAVKKSHH